MSRAAGFSLRNPIKDSNLLIPAGVYPGISAMNKFGESPNITGGQEEEIWDGAAAYSWPATALMTSISQTADQAAMRGETIHIEGLDANWDYVAQDAVLDATLTTTVVTLTTPLLRCFRMRPQPWPKIEQETGPEPSSLIASQPEIYSPSL